MISSGGRRSAASPSSGRVPWSKEKMKYDFGLTSPPSLSLSADGSKATPPRSRSSLKTASRGTCGNRSIRSSTSAVRLPIDVSPPGSDVRLLTVCPRGDVRGGGSPHTAWTTHGIGSGGGPFRSRASGGTSDGRDRDQLGGQHHVRRRGAAPPAEPGRAAGAGRREPARAGPGQRALVQRDRRARRG